MGIQAAAELGSAQRAQQEAEDVGPPTGVLSTEKGPGYKTAHAGGGLDKSG